VSPARESDWDPVRRTRLAAERTELAWWRTALTAIAVAVGVGRVVPELNSTSDEWPYVVLGIGFAVYAALLFGYGWHWSRQVEHTIQRGEAIPPRPGMTLLTGFGVALCLGTIALIAAAA
jgi:uncharacterized membrane protein YidH (DUF202 family)